MTGEGTRGGGGIRKGKRGEKDSNASIQYGRDREK